jgi:hypothetical protein
LTKKARSILKLDYSSNLWHTIFMTRPPRKKIVRKKQPLTQIEHWVAETAATLARQALSKIEDQEKIVGPSYKKALTAQFLSAYVAGLVSEALNDGKGNEEKVMRNFAEAKDLVQLAAAGGFEAALGAYTGEFCEYYCTIKMVPEPLSDLAH